MVVTIVGRFVIVTTPTLTPPTRAVAGGRRRGGVGDVGAAGGGRRRPSTRRRCGDGVIFGFNGATATGRVSGRVSGAREGPAGRLRVGEGCGLRGFRRAVRLLTGQGRVGRFTGWCGESVPAGGTGWSGMGVGCCHGSRGVSQFGSGPRGRERAVDLHCETPADGTVRNCEMSRGSLAASRRWRVAGRRGRRPPAAPMPVPAPTARCGLTPRGR